MMHDSGSKSETLYDKLNNLAAEISEGIIHLSGEQREVVQRELSTLREKAYRERSPEAVYNTALFRKFSELAYEIKDSKMGGRTEKATLIGELPSFVYEADDEDLMVGWEATKTNIFRIRALAAMFALIAFSVMSSVPYISEGNFYPEKHFHSGCTYQGRFDGRFNFRAYQLVIAVGVLAFVHNAAHMVYYALPVDSNRHKYIPGGTGVLALCCRGPNQAEDYSNSLGGFCRGNTKFLEVLFDAVLLVMSVVAFVVSVYVLASGVETLVMDGFNEWTTEYYTLSTVYSTYANESPSCLDEGLDPTSRIRGALAMLFFCTLFLLLSFLVSLRAFRQDPRADLVSFAMGLRGGSEGGAPVSTTSNISTAHEAERVSRSPMASAPMRMLVSSEEAEQADADYKSGDRV